jgi:hypothetical protein
MLQSTLQRRALHSSLQQCLQLHRPHHRTVQWSPCLLCSKAAQGLRKLLSHARHGSQTGALCLAATPQGRATLRQSQKIVQTAHVQSHSALLLLRRSALLWGLGPFKWSSASWAS